MFNITLVNVALCAHANEKSLTNLISNLRMRLIDTIRTRTRKVHLFWIHLQNARLLYQHRTDEGREYQRKALVEDGIVGGEIPSSLRMEGWVNVVEMGVHKLIN